MSDVHPSDPLMKALAALPAVEPDAARSAAIRSRCHTALEAPGSEDRARHLDRAAAGIAFAYAWQVAKLALLLVR